MKESAIASLGAIPSPTNLEAKPDGEGWVRRPKPSQQERMVELREQHATLSKATASAASGLSRYQRKALVEWWTAYHDGEAPGPDVSPEMMTAKFLNPPAKWGKGSPLAYLVLRRVPTATVISPEGRLENLSSTREYRVGIDITEDEAQRLIREDLAAYLPVATVQVTAHSWKRPLDPQPLGVRGQLVLFRGDTERLEDRERFLNQAIEMGDVRIVRYQGRYTDRLEDLNPCPTPAPQNPAGRTEIRCHYPAGSNGAPGHVGVREPDQLPPVARTVEALIPEPPKTERLPEWHETPMTRIVPNAYLELEYFQLFDQQETKVPAWLAGVLTVRRTRHGEPYVNLVDAPIEPLQRFIADVEAFTAENPGARTDHVDFPRYCAV
jgi:hypothetical protein